MKKIWKEIVIFMAGSAMNFLASLLIPTTISPILKWFLIFVCTILSVGGILYGSDLFERIQHYRRIKKRNKKTKKIKIGIISDIDWEMNAQAWATIPIESWEKYLRKTFSSLQVDRMCLDANLDTYHILINPYGETYPEYNKNKDSTLNKIFDYILEGGIFVNTAGVPGYYYYNFPLQRRIDATPPLFDATGSPKRVFYLTPFLRRLDIELVGTHQGLELYVKFLNKLIKVQRMVNRKGIVPIKNIKLEKVISHKQVVSFENMEKSDYETKSYMFWVPYGKGKVLISTIHQGEIKDKEEDYIEYLSKLLYAKL